MIAMVASGAMRAILSTVLESSSLSSILMMSFHSVVFAEQDLHDVQRLAAGDVVYDRTVPDGRQLDLLDGSSLNHLSHLRG